MRPSIALVTFTAADGTVSHRRLEGTLTRSDRAGLGVTELADMLARDRERVDGVAVVVSIEPWNGRAA